MEQNKPLDTIIFELEFPLHYDFEMQSILDKKEKVILNIRGWHWIGELSENKSECAKMQDALGEEVCKLLNEKYAN